MKNYNLHLISLRENKGLNIIEAAKKMGISPISLFLYEKGYFRPGKKNIEKINKFYEIELSLKGLDGYPAASPETVIGKKKNLKGKRIAFAALSLFFALMTAAGAVLFVRSVNNANELYGQTYQDVREMIIKKGRNGHDIVTGMDYSYVDMAGEGENSSSVIFYQSNNILYFNDLAYSKTIMDEETITFERYVYQFGGNLGVNSYLCNFTFGDVLFGGHFTCNFIYDGNSVTHYNNLKVITKGYSNIDDDYVLRKINVGIAEINPAISSVLSEVSAKKVDFYSEFLPAREQGRVSNFTLQIVGLVLLFVGITAFFIFFATFIKLLTLHFKPRFINVGEENEGNSEVPDDLNINVGIPDITIIFLGRIVCFASMVLFILAVSFSAAARIGVSVPTDLSSPTLLEVFKTGWISAVFLNFIISVSRIRKPNDVLRGFVSNLGMFLYIATVETSVYAITNAWGYDLNEVVYKFVPGNVFQVVAINYLILFFLLFVPSFLAKKSKRARVLWCCLSLIPLAVLVVIYYFSNRYAMVYGVQENVLIRFWFPNAFLLLSVVSVFFMYIIFFLRLYFEKKYGRVNSQFFFHGNKFLFIQNCICAALIILVASIDLVFKYNQRAQYLGLGNNYWMFALIPFVLLCKYSPNNQQMYLLDYEVQRIVEE